MSALAELLAGLPDQAAVDAFLGEREFPLVEGRQVTFAWRGEAEQVFLVHWVFGLAQSPAFTRVRGTDLWTLTLELPDRSRIEYKIDVVHGDQHRLVHDGLNPHLANDPFGANSVVHSAGYQHPDFVLHDPEARPGEIVERTFMSDVFRDSRPVQVYLPPRYRKTRRYPLLVVHDGFDYVRFAGLKTVLDNLIWRLEIPPLIALLTQSPDRLNEYAGDPRQGRFLVEELVPLMEQEYPLVHDPSARCLMGASFGAVASLAAAWRHPGVFGKLLLQSGSFVFTDIGEHDRGPVFDPVVDFVGEFRAAPGKPAEQAFVSCGTYESLIYYNRSMVPLLQETGMSVRYRESRDGHNWENWRDRLRDGLSWLFPGPLWMVYE